MLYFCSVDYNFRELKAIVFEVWFPDNSIGITWNFLACKFFVFTPDSLNQKLRGWGSAVCFYKASRLKFESHCSVFYDFHKFFIFLLSLSISTTGLHSDLPLLSLSKLLEKFLDTLAFVFAFTICVIGKLITVTKLP